MIEKKVTITIDINYDVNIDNMSAYPSRPIHEPQCSHLGERVISVFVCIDILFYGTLLASVGNLIRQ